ncbi:hypothetical protein Tco_0695202 [Tanacetum coccineum]
MSPVCPRKEHTPYRSSAKDRRIIIASAFNVVERDGGGVGCAAIAAAYEGGHKGEVGVVVMRMVMASVVYDGVVVGDDGGGSGGGCIEMMTVIRMVSAVGSSHGSNGGCGVSMGRRQRGGATMEESGGKGNDGVGG